MIKVLLYSGGIDSWLISKLWQPDKKIYINIHGNYSTAEKLKLPSDVIIIDCPLLGQFEQNSGYVPLRNLYFLMIAANYGDNLCLGVTAGDTKKDSNINFLYNAEKFLNDLLTDDNRQIKIEKNFANLSKSQILKKVLNKGITIDEIYKNTFSCYSPINNKPCYNCIACFRRFSLLYKNNYQYSINEKKQMYNYIKNHDIKTLIKYDAEINDILYTINELNQEFTE